MSIPISTGSGAASVAAEAVAGLQYQRIEVMGQGGGSVLGVYSDGSIKVSILGIPSISGGVTMGVNTGGADNNTSNQTQGIGSGGGAGGGLLMYPAVYNGTNWDRLRGNSSVGAVVTTGASSVITVGTYAEDSAHTSGDMGKFVLAVRNDTLSSITSADSDYSPIGVGPTGAITAHDAPITKWIQGTADLRVVLGSSVTAIPAQGASIFTYIREIQVANMGSASVLVTFAGGLGSILGYTIAPAGGGSNIYYQNALKTPANGTFAASLSGVASVFVSAQGFQAKI